MEQLKRWRQARKAFAKSHTYLNAVELQVASRDLRAASKKQLTVIEGGKHATGLRHRN